MSTQTVKKYRPEPEQTSPTRAGLAPVPEPLRRPPWLVRTIRSNPYVYSAVCKARLGYSRYFGAAKGRASLRQNHALWHMSETETSYCNDLKRQGYALLTDFLPASTVDEVQQKADRLFKELQIDMTFGYSVQNKKRRSLEGLSYRELAESEKVIALRDPLIHIPECLAIGLDETLLRIVVNFLGYVPTSYEITVVRDFPFRQPRESSNFHKDNDEADSVQAFIYLVDIDDSCGHLVYIPGTNRYDPHSCRPRLNRDLGIDANDGRYSDDEILKYYPPGSWARLKTPRGSLAIIHGNGIHKGPCWPRPGDSTNRPRTAIKIDINGWKRRARPTRKNRMTPRQFELLSDLQKTCANPIFV